MYNESNLRSTRIIYPELSYKIVGCLFDVYNELGGGYQEKFYQKALEECFRKNNIIFTPQAPFNVMFHGKIIGKYYMDFIIENKVVLEIKRGDYFARTNIKQIVDYLKAVNLQLGILANFTNNKIRYIRILNAC